MPMNILSESNYNNLICKIRKTFQDLKKQETKPITIPTQSPIRSSLVNWLQFLCKSLNFSEQTLLRAVILLDKYSEKCQINCLNQQQLNLLAIACLSLSTKLEETNCNYVQFFTEKVLNTPDMQIFTVKDLTKMELNILKKLNFKTLYSTAIEFGELYVKIFNNIKFKHRYMPKYESK